MKKLIIQNLLDLIGIIVIDLIIFIHKSIVVYVFFILSCNIINQLCIKKRKSFN
ncbi:putative integral membrane protein (apicoplast) [Theileria parva strain Muguga]|uniref:Uncharacterized protein n=1 Tax=Theileria parva TaxID=5875 RepID=Q4MY87_THEPA|nr:putative integral membrane protein [Theileria parva strain Muguga]|eukprot:XP_762705.1 hypothetical protein (apicoplast) [Theileria parva strain Muguga]